MENTDYKNKHVLEERGIIKQSDEPDQSEEMKYSGVIRNMKTETNEN